MILLIRLVKTLKLEKLFVLKYDQGIGERIFNIIVREYKQLHFSVFYIFVLAFSIDQRGRSMLFFHKISHKSNVTIDLLHKKLSMTSE